MNFSYTEGDGYGGYVTTRIAAIFNSPCVSCLECGRKVKLQLEVFETTVVVSKHT